jgi:hypothetical protein
MSERDDLIGTTLTDVRREVAGFIQPPGAAAVASTVHRRRRIRVVATAILAVTLVGAAGVGFAVARNEAAPVPTPADSPAPSVSQSAPVSEGPSTPSAPTAADSIPAAELLNATLLVPPWPEKTIVPCPSGPIKFTNGKSTEQYSLAIMGQPGYTDVDHDGDREAVVTVVCSPQTVYHQVLVYDRAPSGGIRLVGRVLATPVGQARDGIDVVLIHAVQTTADGHIRIDVGDYNPCCGISPDLPQHQWRTYGWDGQRFVQTGGPTAFGPNPKVTDLRPSAQDFVMVRQSDGTWRGSGEIKVINVGPNSVRAGLHIRFTVPVTLGPDSSPAEVNDRFIEIRLADPVPAGGWTSVRLTLLSTVNPAGTAAYTAYTGPDMSYPDARPDDNTVVVRVLTQ